MCLNGMTILAITLMHKPKQWVMIHSKRGKTLAFSIGIWRPGHDCDLAEIPLYQTPSNLSRGHYAQKSKVKSPAICAILLLDVLQHQCYNTNTR